MGNFLKKAKEILFDKRIDLRNRDDFKRVFKSIDNLRNEQIEEKLKKEIDWDNIESVFSVFEEIQSMGDLSISSEDRISILPSLKGLIFETLAQSIIFPPSAKRELEYHQPPYPYGLFATLLYKIKTAYNISLITFNYDFSLDYALNLLNLPYGYSLDEDHSTIPLLKPHGSLNWALCNKCGRISPIKFEEYGQNYFNSHLLDKLLVGTGKEPQAGKNMHLEMRNLLDKHECPYCSRAESLFKPIFCNEEPFIIPPTKNKNYEKLKIIHDKVKEEISSADYIYIIGYSFPESDNNYIRKYIDENAERYERMIIINPDKSLKNQFENYNHKIKIKDSRFGESINTIAEDLDINFTEIKTMADNLGLSIGLPI